MKILAEISVGELYDKITILNIKLKKINDPNKLKNIKIELDTLVQQSNQLILKDDEKLRKSLGYHISQNYKYKPEELKKMSFKTIISMSFNRKKRLKFYNLRTNLGGYYIFLTIIQYIMEDI